MPRQHNPLPLCSLVALLLCCSALHAQCDPDWSSVGGGGSSSTFDAMAVFDDDGDGPMPPALYLGTGKGTFAGVKIWMLARWDGWTAKNMITPGDTIYTVHHLYVVPDGLGALHGGLYVGGAFKEIEGEPFGSIARWDGKGWHDVGGGVDALAPFVFAQCTYEEDDGHALFVGGQFQSAGGVATNGLARWNGESWSKVGGGLSKQGGGNANVFALGVYDDGRGPALYVGGGFDYAGGKLATRIARWDGSEWEPVGAGLDAAVHALCVYDEDGDGPEPPALFAGGQFSYAGYGNPVQAIARWDGKAWTPVGGWSSGGSVLHLRVWKGPDDVKENLYSGGFFNVLPDNTPVGRIARWDGTEWRAVGAGVCCYGPGTSVKMMADFDEDRGGPNPAGLYVSGPFHYAGDYFSTFIARWGCPLPPKCDADLDGNGVLNLFDFLAFTSAFNAQDPAADCDQSAALDLFDFLCFASAFNAGC